MHQICKVKESKQQEGQTSFPILLVDGTGSMNYEFQHVVDAWRKVFNSFGQHKLEYQWEDGLFHLDEPFRCAGWGDITKTFLQIFDILLTRQLPQNITIIFVSDGQERFDLNQLTQKIKEVTDKYIISFISLAIGSSFPNDISNKLYLQLHNSNRNFVPMYERERKYDSNLEEMQKYFVDTFEDIKSQLSFCSVVYECDKNVKLTFVSEPTTRVTSGAIILADSEVRINGEVVELTNSEEDKKAIIVSSVQQALVNYGSNPNEQAILKDFDTIKEISEKIYKPEKIETDKSFLAVQEFVESVASREIEFGLLTSEKLTKIQSNLTNPEKLSQVVQSVSIAEDPNNLEAPVILKCFKKKVAACFVRAKSFLKIQKETSNEQQCVAQIIKETNNVIKSTLQKYLNKLEKEKPKDCKKLIREFYETIQGKLNELDKLDPGQISDEIQDESLALNQILEILVQLDKEKQVSWEQASNKIKFGLSADISQSIAIAEQQDDYKYLPFFKQGKSDEDWETILFTIFDQNDRMKEQNLALQVFNETFIDMDEDKVIKLSWKNNSFTLNQESFDKLKDILNKFEHSHKLREKKIFITIVSDGLTDYKSLHKNFKSAKSNFCNIRFIYVAVGLNFKVALENDLQKKFHNRDVKGKPTIYTIPRQQFSQSVNYEKVAKPFQKAFEELRDKLFKEKEKAPQRLSQVFSSSISIRKSVVSDQTNNQQDRDESNQNLQQFGEISQQNDQQFSTSDQQSQVQINQQNYQNQEFQDQQSQLPEEQQQQLNTNNKQEENIFLENLY